MAADNQGKHWLRRVAPYALLAGVLVGFTAAYCWSKKTTVSNDSTDDKEEPEKPATPKREPSKNPDEWTVDEVIKLADEVLNVQVEVTKRLYDVIERIVANELTTFEDVYNHFSQLRNLDPISENGLTVAEFDAIVEHHARDSAVNDRIVKIINGPSPLKASPGVLPPETVIKMNRAMLDILKDVRVEVEKLSTITDMDKRAASLATQAIVGAKLQKQYDLTCENVEESMMKHFSTLSLNPEFVSIQNQIQNYMAEIGEKS